MPTLDSLPPPARSFASDNSAGVHPSVMAALSEANVGHALAYGNDRWTTAAVARFRDLFGGGCEALMVWGGTGANNVALASMLGPAQAVVCTEGSHINVDETGAPERILGAKLIDVPTEDGKLRPEQVEAVAHAIGVEHHAQPGVVSITQSTELGTLYSADEIGALADVAHSHGMTVHMDGARIANAAVALGMDVRSFTVDVGVDVISFGGTKNGMMYGEAVVYLNAALARSAPYLRKQVTPAPVEDAVRLRPVHRAPDRRPLAAQRSTGQRDGGPPVRAGARRRRGRARRRRRPSTASSPACPRTPSSGCGRGASSTTGTRPRSRCGG